MPSRNKTYDRETTLFIAGQLRLAREDSSMSQTELAARSGIMQSNVSKLERGVRCVRHSTLKRLADVFGCETTDFLP